MTSWYRKIDVRMYGDEWFCSLSDPAKYLWIYLLTGDHTDGLPGLFRLGEMALAEALGWSLKKLRKYFGEIAKVTNGERPRVIADWESRVVLVSKAIHYNPPENENVIKSWAKIFDRVPECELRNRWLDRTIEFVALKMTIAPKRTEKTPDQIRAGLIATFKSTFYEPLSVLYGERLPELYGEPPPNCMPTPKPHPKPHPNSSSSPPGGADKEKSPDEAYKAAQLLAGLMRENDPKAKIPKDLATWAVELDRLNRRDDRSWPEIETVIRWCQQDEFWCSNILSARKLRKHFQQLALKMNTGEEKLLPSHRPFDDIGDVVHE